MEAGTASLLNHTIAKHSIVNEMFQRTTANRKKATEKRNRSPFAFVTALDNEIAKRLTHTPCLSQYILDSAESNERRPNPFNQRFNRTKVKMKRFQQMHAKKARAKKVRQDVRQKVHDKSTATSAIFVKNLETDDDVYIYPTVVEEPTVISSDEEEVIAAAEVEIQNGNSQDGDIRKEFDDPFGGGDVARSSAISGSSESKGRELCESDGSDTNNRLKRMRKRRKLGSNRGSDYANSDDTEDGDDIRIKKELSKTRRSHGDQNRDISLSPIDSSDDSEINGPTVQQQDNDKESGVDDWTVTTVTDEVGETNDVALEKNCANDDPNADVVAAAKNELNADKGNESGIPNGRLVINPEMGWNDEMKAFYNDSWGGETHNANAIRRKMPQDGFEWRLDDRDQRTNHNILKATKCYNCRQNGHRTSRCPQPKRRAVCFTCGSTGHSEPRCPNAICLRCGERTNSYVRGCERCQRTAHIVCRKCRQRGHMARECPDNWRAYHNTTDPAATPGRIAMNPPRKFCSVCAAPGHRADQCYDFEFLMQEECQSSDIRIYEKVYAHEAIDNSMSTPYSLLQNPAENFKFTWDVNENSDRIYGRFMAATGIRRDEEAAVRVKRRKSASKAKFDGKSVLNPMKVQSIRKKLKKQIADRRSSIARNVLRHEETVPESRNPEVDNDVEMKETEPEATEHRIDCDEPVNIASVNELRGSNALGKPTFDLRFVENGSVVLNATQDSDSNYSCDGYFETKTDNERDRDSPDNVPLPPHIDSSDVAAASKLSALEPLVTSSTSLQNSTKIFLTKQHARLLLLTEAGKKLLTDALLTHHVKVRTARENHGNVLIVDGTPADQNKFHADLIHSMEELCKKVRVEHEGLHIVPKSKDALIRFIREQFALLLYQPLGTVNELYESMKRYESWRSKNADRARKHLNIILMGRAGLREGKFHLSGLESSLKLLLESTKDKVTQRTREEIYGHYEYVFSPIKHDDYPELISQYEEMERTNSIPTLHIDKRLMESETLIRDEESDGLNQAKQKLLRATCHQNSDSPTIVDQERVDKRQPHTKSSKVDDKVNTALKQPSRNQLSHIWKKY